MTLELQTPCFHCLTLRLAIESTLMKYHLKFKIKWAKSYASPLCSGPNEWDLVDTTILIPIDLRVVTLN